MSASPVSGGPALEKQASLALRDLRIAIQMLRGERRKDRTEIDSIAENARTLEAMLATREGATHEG